MHVLGILLNFEYKTSSKLMVEKTSNDISCMLHKDKHIFLIYLYLFEHDYIFRLYARL